MTIEADVCIVGSGAGGGVIAGELARAGKQVCVVEMGGYYNEADFNGLELGAYERMYLNGGPFPTAEGQVSLLAGSCLGRRHDDQLDQLAAPAPLGRRAVGARARARGRRRRRLPAPLRRGDGAHDGQRRVLAAQRAARAPARRVRGARLRLPRHAPQHRPRDLRPRRSPATWATATSPARSRGRSRPTSPTRTSAAPTSSCTAASRGSWSRTAAPPASRAPTPAPTARPRASSSAPRRSSWPPARSSRRRCCCARASAARRSASTCGCIRRASSAVTTPSPRTRGSARRRRRCRTSSPTSRTATAS